MSRKEDIKEMANFVGNSAAHFALFPDDGFVRKEIETYMGVASELARRTWNDLEIGEFRGRARRRAASEIKRRTKEEELDQKAIKKFMATAEKYIDEFIGSEMRRKG